jgi:hypothetical protein
MVAAFARNGARDSDHWIVAVDPPGARIVTATGSHEARQYPQHGFAVLRQRGAASRASRPMAASTCPSGLAAASGLATAPVPVAAAGRERLLAPFSPAT